MSARNRSNQRGFSMVEAMAGLVISATVMGGVVAVITQLAAVDSGNRLQSLVNQVYFEGVRLAENPYMFNERNLKTINPLGIGTDLGDCLAGRGDQCDTKFRAQANTPVPATLDPLINSSFDLEGACQASAPTCLVTRTATYSWSCPSPTSCSGLTVNIRAVPIVDHFLRTDVKIKARSGSVNIPSRQFRSKGEIRFTCAGNGIKSLYSIDFRKMTDAGGCGAFSSGAACAMPMKLYASGDNCQPAQDFVTRNSCADKGLAIAGLYQSQSQCIGDQAFTQPCPNGGERQADGTCFYANRWCPMSSMDPNSTPLGFRDQGARHAAGCGAGNGFYQPGQMYTDGTNYLKCISGPYADFPVPDSFCQPVACPTGQTRQADGTCKAAPTGQLTWNLRNVGHRDPVLLYGQYSVLRDPAGNLCNDGWQTQSGVQGVQTATYPTHGLASNPSDCPNINGSMFTALKGTEGGSCATAGSKCFWSTTADYNTVVTPGVHMVRDQTSTCVYLLCTDASKCPDGSPKGGDGTCPNTSGLWLGLYTEPPNAASITPCNPNLEEGVPCSPIGQRCRSPWSIPPNNAILECSPNQ